MSTEETQCARCGKAFQYPYLLKRHQQSKRTCVPLMAQAAQAESPHSCKFCGKGFTRYDAMRRHIRTTCRIAPNKRNGEEGMDRLYEYFKQRQQREDQDLRGELQGLRAELAGVKAQLSPPAAASSSGSGIRVAGNQNTTVTINQLQDNRMNVVVFGQESTAHLDAGAIKRLLDEAVGLEAGPAAALAMLRTAEEIYSNRSHPENITCFLPNKKTREALVHGAAGWEVRPEAAVLPAIAQKSHTALFNAQPLPELEGCEGMRSHRDYLEIYKELQANEKLYNSGVLGLRELLVRNKALLEVALGALPRAEERPNTIGAPPRAECSSNGGAGRIAAE